MQRMGAMLLRRATVLAAATTLGLLAMSGAANAATFTVTTTNDSNDGACTPSLCSLRDAVVAADAAGGASTITVPAGTFKLTIPATASDDPTNGDLDIDHNASITITGAGSGSTVIDANNIDRAFAVQQGAGLTLAGMTIENGNPNTNSTGDQYGGAVYSDGALTVTGDVTFKDNNAYNGEYGGAIYTASDQTVLSLTGATFEDNVAYYGGAIYLDTDTNESSVRQSITDSTFISNNAPDEEGGAINVQYGDLTVSHSTFTGNTSSDGDGGAIFEDTDAGYRLTLTSNTFDSNSSYYGGALYYEYGNLTASGNTFSRNHGYDGGAVYQENYASSSNASVFNNTFVGNSAYEGGALYNEEDYVTLSFDNNTLSHNQATGDGGGIYDPEQVHAGSSYANNIVALNPGGDCSDGPVGATLDVGNNLDSDSSCFATGGSGTTPESAGDLVSTNPDLGPLANNGGPTETQALLPGSPAIDAGNNAECPSTDQRGVPRPQGASCDIGAFEAAASHLSVSNSAPSSGVTGEPFTYTVSVSSTGPGPSTGTTVVDQLPAGETLYGVTPSQGSCTSSGSPAKVTCALGSIDNGNHATVTLVVSEANAGSVTDTATATNDQGANVSDSATTKLVAPVAPAGAHAPKAKTGGHSHVTKHSAKVRGKVTNGGQPTWYFFQYGRSRHLGEVTRLVRIRSSRNVSATIRHLLSGKTCYFRLVAINDSGNSFGSIHRFRTKRSHHKHH